MDSLKKWNSPFTMIFLLLLGLLAVIVLWGVVSSRFNTMQTVETIIVGLITSLIASLIFSKIQGVWPEKHKILARWKNRIKRLIVLPTQLSIERKAEIIDFVQIYEPLLRSRRREHLLSVKRRQVSEWKKGTFKIKRPAWYNLCTTSSPLGYRLTIGFKNKGCFYWRDNPDKVGCYHCGYASSTIQNGTYLPTRDDLLAQFDYALEKAHASEVNIDVVEFLNDGSFFNFDEEFPEGFADALFRKVGQLKNIKRVLVESRPVLRCNGEPFITKEKIENLLRYINPEKDKEGREGKILEIGIGLETHDEFIKDACINKGYNNQDFEDAVKIIASFKKSCSIVVYTLVKPAFLTENEAIADVVGTLKYLSEISHIYQVPVIPKLEPAVVARGTLLDILHFDTTKGQKERYEPLSYWSVVEIIARAYLIGLEGNIRIGARDDMDIIEKVPAIYNADGTFNQHDFWIYESVQRFNTHHNFIKLLSEIKLVMERDNCFRNWELITFKNKEKSSISKVIEQEKDRIELMASQSDQKRKEEFLLQVFRVLDAIELHDGSIEFAQKILKRRRNGESHLKAEVEEFIKSKFGTTTLYVSVRVKSIFFERDLRQLLRISFHLREMSEGVLYEIWVGIPTLK